MISMNYSAASHANAEGSSGRKVHIDESSNLFYKAWANSTHPPLPSTTESLLTQLSCHSITEYQLPVLGTYNRR